METLARLFVGEIILIFVIANILFIEQVFTKSIAGLSAKNIQATYAIILTAGIFLIRDYSYLGIAVYIVALATGLRFMRLKPQNFAVSVAHSANLKFYLDVYLKYFLTPLFTIFAFAIPGLVLMFLILHA